MQCMPHMPALTLPVRRDPQVHAQLTMGKAVESQLWSSEENTAPQRCNLSFTGENPIRVKCGQRNLHGLNTD